MGKSWLPQPIDGVPDRVILFDGVCVFCSRWVRFVIARDRGAKFRFVAVQEPRGTVLARRLDIDLAFAETSAVILADHAYFKSDAAIRVLALLPGWAWTRIFLAVPRRLRDGFYDRISLNRYRLFGRRETCLVPTPELLRHFLRDGVPPG